MKTETVKILCHTCEGEGSVLEVGYETRKNIRCVCPECGGLGYVLDEKLIDKTAERYRDIEIKEDTITVIDFNGRIIARLYINPDGTIHEDSWFGSKSDEDFIPPNKKE